MDEKVSFAERSAVTTECVVDSTSHVNNHKSDIASNTIATRNWGPIKIEKDEMPTTGRSIFDTNMSLFWNAGHTSNRTPTHTYSFSQGLSLENSYGGKTRVLASRKTVIGDIPSLYFCYISPTAPTLSSSALFLQTHLCVCRLRTIWRTIQDAQSSESLSSGLILVHGSPELTFHGPSHDLTRTRWLLSVLLELAGIPN